MFTGTISIMNSVALAWIVMGFIHTVQSRRVSKMYQLNVILTTAPTPWSRVINVLYSEYNK